MSAHSTDNEIENAINLLLESNYKITVPDGRHTRYDDDCIGENDWKKHLQVIVEDGAAQVYPLHERKRWLIFRSKEQEGKSHRIRKALAILAIAIDRDNEEDPQFPNI